MDRLRTQICANTNQIGAISCVDGVVLLEYFTSADDVNIKYFHCRQPQSIPGTDYDSAINVRICCNGVPGRAGAMSQVQLYMYVGGI